MSWQIEIVRRSRVNIDGVETRRRAIDDLQPLSLLHGQVDEQRLLRQRPEGLQGVWEGLDRGFQTDQAKD